MAARKSDRPSRKSAGRTLVTLLSPDQIEQSVRFIRGRRVLLDEQLAAFYGVETRTLAQAVRRNADRFPGDFMFQLTEDEWQGLRSRFATSTASECADDILRSQTVISSDDAQAIETQRDVSNKDLLKSQSVTSSSKRHGGRRYAPYAFTEQGVAMLSSVLRSKQAVAVNIEIMRAFVRLRQLLTAHKELADRIAALERAMTDRDAEVDSRIEEIVALLAQLFNPPEPPKAEIGFHAGKKQQKKKRGNK
jgi:hypothetical protein